MGSLFRALPHLCLQLRHLQCSIPSLSSHFSNSDCCRKCCLLPQASWPPLCSRLSPSVPRNLRCPRQQPQSLSQLSVLQVFSAVDPCLSVHWNGRDGARVAAGTKFGSVTGSARSILVAERIALNFMQRMGGIATATAEMVELIQVWAWVRRCAAWRMLVAAHTAAIEINQHNVSLSGDVQPQVPVCQCVLSSSGAISPSMQAGGGCAALLCAAASRAQRHGRWLAPRLQT